ncbi:MAG: hypothetical protein NVS1B4_23330 [Gemmatimonadaceae bacterium]
MPAPATSLTLRVRYSETDQMGVVYHANYLVWCEVGRTDFIRTRGVSYAQMEREGMLLAVAEASVRYRAPVRYDDIVRVDTVLTEIRSRGVVFDYVISNAASGARCATARTTLVALDRATRPMVLSPTVRERLAGPPTVASGDDARPWLR